MRKQTKIAAIVSAAALLALGASITSFAAVKGTWRIEDGEWKCYDKNGDAYENTFAVSNGKEYYVGEDGFLVRSDWVEYDGSYYFVNSAGQKITNDWRLTTPYENEDEDEEWYYFQSSGKRADGKKITWKGKTYYFDTDGKMLTGWVTADGNEAANEATTFEVSKTYYCNEDGSRVTGDWVEAVEPGTEYDDADADTHYYYFGSNGKAVTGKKNSINGQTYIFNEDGQMLSGWVAYTAANTAHDKPMEAYELYKEDDATEILTAAGNGYEIYYCSEADDGHAKKNKWIKTWAPEDIDNAEEDDQAWFWIEKNGKLYVTPNDADLTTNRTATKYSFKDGQLVKSTTSGEVGVQISKKKVNSKDYWFGTNGEMVSGFWMIYDKVYKEDKVTIDTTKSANHMYYFGGKDDGSMKTGSQSVKDDAGDTYKFYFSTKTDQRGVGITGNQGGKLYYYGRLLQATDYKYQLAEVNGWYFIVNSNGSIQHGQMDYKEDGDTLIFAKTTYQTDADGKVKKALDKVGGKKVDLKDYSVVFAEKAQVKDKTTNEVTTDGYTNEAYKNAVLGVYKYTVDGDGVMVIDTDKTEYKPDTASFLQDVDKESVIDDISANGLE